MVVVGLLSAQKISKHFIKDFICIFIYVYFIRAWSILSRGNFSKIYIHCICCHTIYKCYSYYSCMYNHLYNNKKAKCLITNHSRLPAKSAGGTRKSRAPLNSTVRQQNMDRINIIRIVTFLALTALCVSIVILGAHLERTERFGNVFLAAFGSLFIFTFLGKIDMSFPGFTAKASNRNHLFARVIGFVCGIAIVSWGVSRAIVA